MKNQIRARKGGCVGSLVKWFLIVLVIVIAVVYFFSGTIVDKVISTVGKSAGVEMGSSTKIGFFPLEFEMRKFYIANPDGFKEGNAVSFKEVRFEMPINVKALKGDEPLVIDEIRILAPYLSYEQANLLSSSNLAEIQKKFAALLPESSGGKASAEPKEKSEGAPRKFIIKKIVFEDGKVNATISGRSLDVPMPSFTITDLGVKENGVTGGEAAGKIFVDLMGQALNSVAKNATNLGSDVLKQGSEKGSDALKGALNSIFGE